VEAARLEPYHAFLLIVLSTATFFEGFDASMLGLAAPDVRADLGIERSQWGVLYSVTRVGMVLSFVLLLFADRFGRRALLLTTVIGFAIATGATSVASSPWEFAFWQFLARLFLTAEYALAVIAIGEEFPAHLRGRAVSLLTSFASLGTVAMAKVQPFLLLQPGAPGNALHDFAQRGVLLLQSALGLAPNGADWRGVYLLGLAPLALMLVLRASMRETRRYAAVASARPRVPLREELRAHAKSALQPFAARYRRRTAIVALLWNCVYLVTAPSVAYWVIYAREEVGLSPAQVGDIVFWAYLAGAVGNFTGGVLIDRIGRRFTCAGLYTLAGIAIVMLFHAQTLVQQYVWHISTVFAFGAAIAATHIYASELFPTEIRATGYGWASNVFGRATEVVAPTVIGALIPALGISWAVTCVGFGPILGAVLVLRLAPETRGLTLEQVQESLDGGLRKA
jgi:putative MFS transporter